MQATMAPPAPSTLPARNLGDETCASCGRQLAILSGTLMRGLQPGEILERDGAGEVAEKDLERDARGKVTDRARRKLYVGCGTCRAPVLPDHPQQVKIDRQWAESDAATQKERERAAKTPPPARVPYTELNPVAFVEQQLDAAKARNVAQDKRIATLEKQVAELTKKK